jgi:hypothetical protein
VAKKRTEGEEAVDKQLFSLRLPRRLWAELSVLARLRDRPLNDVLTEWIQAQWDVQPEKSTVARLVKGSGAAAPRERDKVGDSE